MTATPPSTGMEADTPATTTRSTRRTRRLAIIGALALVLVAGAVLVGVKTTGARSGASYTGATCATNGECKLGEIGPGGGTVVYVATVDFQCGLNLTDTCRYLEAAKASWYGSWFNGSNYTDVDPRFVWTTASSKAAAYAGGGKADWHLPTKGELNILYTQRPILTKWYGSTYWSSSAFGTSTTDVWYQTFDNAVPAANTQQHGSTNTTSMAYVRPVRTF